MTMPEYNRMQLIKRRFYAMRNGIIADTLRKAGLGYKIIFGLNLPQITEIASGLTADADLAEELWADRRTRESMLLAPMLYPVSSMDISTAKRWMHEAPTTEVADVLCLKLLRHLPEALDIAIGTIAETDIDDMTRYTALRLMFNVLNTASSPAGREAGLPSPEETARMIRPVAECERDSGNRLTHNLSLQLLDEIDFILE